MPGPESVTLRFDPAGRAPRRYVFEPVAEPAKPDWRLSEQTWTGEEWRQVGGEYVDDISIDDGRE